MLKEANVLLALLRGELEKIILLHGLFIIGPDGQKLRLARGEIRIHCY